MKPREINLNMVGVVAEVVTAEAEQVNSEGMVVQVSTFLYSDYCNVIVPINFSLIFEPNFLLRLFVILDRRWLIC